LRQFPTRRRRLDRPFGDRKSRRRRHPLRAVTSRRGNSLGCRAFFVADLQHSPEKRQGFQAFAARMIKKTPSTNISLPCRRMRAGRASRPPTVPNTQVNSWH